MRLIIKVGRIDYSQVLLHAMYVMALFSAHFHTHDSCFKGRPNYKGQFYDDYQYLANIIIAFRVLKKFKMITILLNKK